jgi:hypothetical protein
MATCGTEQKKGKDEDTGHFSKIGQRHTGILVPQLNHILLWSFQSISCLMATEAAMSFYQQALGAEQISMQRYGDSPMPSVDPAWIRRSCIAA